MPIERNLIHRLEAMSGMDEGAREAVRAIDRGGIVVVPVPYATPEWYVS